MAVKAKYMLGVPVENDGVTFLNIDIVYETQINKGRYFSKSFKGVENPDNANV